MDITNFLTPKSKPFYDLVISIVEKLEEYQQKVDLWKIPDGLECNIVIFGGFIRDLILHYFEYQKDDNSEFNKPKDIDLWFHYKSPYDTQYHKFSHSMTSWERYLSALKKIMRHHSEYDVEDSLTGFIHSYEITDYCVLTMTIDNIRFDMCANINKYSGESFTTFKDLSDFTVNNLFIDTKGMMKKRINYANYTLDDCIDDIKHKKLHNIFIDPGNEYGVRFDAREKKMLSYGYTY